jgi:hypothetical protein
MIEDPNKVLVPVDDLEWNPERPISEAIKIAEESLKTRVDKIDFAVELSGTFANKFQFIKTLLSSLGMPDNEIDTYILCSGIEEQFRKLAEGASAKH